MSGNDHTSHSIWSETEFKEIGINHLSVYPFGAMKTKNLETSIVETGIMLKCGLVMKLQVDVVSEVTGKIEIRPLNLLYSMEVAGTNEINPSNNMTEKEKEIGGTNQDNNVDNEIQKRSISKPIASKNSQARTQLQLCNEDS